jgi:GTP-binding protein Era
VGSLEKVLGRWRAALPTAQLLPISAMDGQGLEGLMEAVKAQLPLGPPLYPNDTLTDRTQRFFASEIIRWVRGGLTYLGCPRGCVGP